ncbi:MFS transporter [Williamsia deligens]|uniref:MFS transporter n=1 Tax=Williamsia deligens TaxID=321325 RepID=A0ABW3GGL4_9NOCA|nr:MFS transporter [Williamsia deligens]MCP2195485.1 Nitrate/nitrite transporter NarK [Williamsia deligens]
MTAPTPAAVVRGVVRSSSTVRLLVLTQLVFNTGFFMVLPYLAVHLTDGVGQGAAVVGAVLGLRTLMQQGLFVVGGAVADRFGARPVVVTGCLCRAAGFIALGWAGSLPAIVVSVCLTGFAGALFSPAVDAELAHATTDGASAGTAHAARLEGFALMNLGGQVGAAAGPVIGAALLTVDFRVVCVTSAAVFVVMSVVHLRMFPTGGRQSGIDRTSGEVRRILRDRTFVAFALVVSVQVVIYNQLYFLLPDAVEGAWGSQTPMGVLFAIAAITVVVAQLRVSAQVVDRAPGHVLAAGLGVVAVGPLVAALVPVSGLTGPPAVVVLAVFVFSAVGGQMIVGPALRAVIPALARGRHLGTHYGLCASVGGILVLPCSAAVGALVDHLPAEGIGAAVPWWSLAAWAAIAAVICRRWSVPALRGR